MPLFSGPKDDLSPQYQPLPTGHYQGDVIALELTPEGSSEKDAAWQAIRGQVTNLTTIEGESVARSGTKEVPLGGKTRRFQITVAGSNPKSIEIGAQQTLKLAQALGVATEENGEVFVEGDTLEEVLGSLKMGEGARVNFSLQVGPRMRGNVVVTKEGTDDPVIDEEIKTFWPLEE
jgi:hypothetical protein